MQTGAKRHPLAPAMERPAGNDLSGRAAATFTNDAVRVADIIGVLPILNELAELDMSGRPDPVNRLIRRQQLTDRVLVTLFEVASSTAELTCERDRADQVADRMDEIDNAGVKRLTVASIVFGGIAGIISGGVGLAAGASLAGEAADVGGGLLASWFGLSALFTHSDIEFRHERNPLREIWEGPANPVIFSPTVWRFLHYGDGTGGNRPREQVVEAWHQGGRLGERDSAEEQRRQTLFFGTGGRYTAAELRAWASMLETLEAAIRLMHEDLEVLLTEIAEYERSLAVSDQRMTR